MFFVYHNNNVLSLRSIVIQNKYWNLKLSIPVIGHKYIAANYSIYAVVKLTKSDFKYFFSDPSNDPFINDGLCEGTSKSPSKL